MELAFFRIISFLSAFFFVLISMYPVFVRIIVFSKPLIPLVNHKFVLLHLEPFPVLMSVYIAGSATLYSARTFKIKEDEELR